MKKFNSVEKAAYLNNRTYSTWFNRFYSIALSRFEWINLPDSVDERYLELSLFWRGSSLFFIDEVMGYLALPLMSNSPLNVYGVPTLRTAYSYGYTSDIMTPDNSVIIYNNYTRTPDSEQIKMYAMRLYEIERSIDTNVKAQKTPILIECEDKARFSLLNLYEQYDGNIPVIFSKKGGITGTINSIRTDAPFVADKLQILKHQYFQEAMNFLGVEANTSEKTERQVTDEITTNMGSTEASRQSALNARKQACTQINKLFGLNIDCRFRSNLKLSQLMENFNIEESEENGEI